MYLVEKFLRLLNCIEPSDKLIKVKSWKPVLTEGHIEWPCLLIDTTSLRMTISPVWDRSRISNILF